MKYTTFRNIRLIAFIALPIVGIVLLFRSCSGGSPPVAELPPQPPAVQRQSLPMQERPDYNAAELPLRPIEREILDLQRAPLSEGKQDDNGSIKRVLTKNGYKVDLRCDTQKGFSTWNRAKVDWNNNRKYDEKWSFRENGVVARNISPDDNEDYSIEYRLRGDKWVRK
ncbi:MAG: hypothetical protein JNL32_02190 [Candidatus Kapabacteria bacterium]|nr:hypothetical protein [Candidatus Kapabacteria bacterium]